MSASALSPRSLRLPNGYESVRLGYVARLQNGLTVDAKRDVTGDVVTRPYLRVANVQAGSLDLESVTEITVPRGVARRSTLRPGDVLMTEGGDLDKLGRGTVWQGELDGCLHQNHIFAIRPDPQRLSGRFLAYVTQSLYGRSYFESTGTRTTNLASTNSSKIQSFPLPLPPPEEQRRIVDFLDAETARIDALIDARQHQLPLLSARDQSVLDEVNSSSKEAQTPVKYLVDKVTSGPRGWGEFLSDEGTPFIRITNIPRRGIDLDLSDLAKVDAPRGAERQRTRTRAGDVLVSITADVGSVAVVAGAAVDGNVSQHVALLRPKQDKCDSRWLAYALKSPRAQQVLAMNSYGGTKVGLGLADVANLMVPRLPGDRQRSIAEGVDRKLQVTAQIRASITRQLAALAERRQSLITAAVTGQLDVTTARQVTVA
ncbi:restriction endonuclease subunit S [Streptomyces sp. NBC_00124]|uniref:restriction endonuclease subunit S n=1 Tax=Streptomyces sp. NBC_00124 TaxID=2975662 RepID=UPI002256C8BA|nr:restriction endonuclease subunit S [Streptomyces sp. NBC_00124]MCX5364059.1 restriction endonuclease subunit S [Streptomyces sp. NBC_00124]